MENSTVHTFTCIHEVRPSLQPFSTKPFKKASKNSFLSVEPPSLKFMFKEGKIKFHKKIKLNNISGKAGRVYILPPQSEYFSINYENKGNILPGLPLIVDVGFCGKERRQYSDWLKIVCPGEYNMMIPLEALPATPYNKIPHKISLGSVPLGVCVKSRFTIDPSPGKEVKFLVFLPAPSPDFSVQPTRGVIKENDPPVDILIKFLPTEYTTVQYPIQLYILDISLSPYPITVTADCKPGLIRDKLVDAQQEKTAKLQKSPSRTIAVRQVEKSVVAKSKTQKKQQGKRTGSLPALNTIHGVTTFLTSKKLGNNQCDELLGPLNRTIEEDHAVWMAKELQFKNEAMQYQTENRATSMHLKEKLGQPLCISSEMQEKVLAKRVAQWEHYKSLLSSEIPNDLYTRTTSQCILKRTIRNIDVGFDLTFSDTPTDMWFVRYQSLCKFIQAARRVILQNRLRRVLQLLKESRISVNKEVTEKEE